LRQADVARLAGVSPKLISRIECGRIDGVVAGRVMRVARALDIRLEWNAWWRGGELDRMVNAGHAAMHESVARWLRGSGSLIAPEASFSIYGERGVIDVLAFEPASRALLVVELKTQLVDVQALLGAVDRYRRLAPALARERGWEAQAVSAWVVLRDTATNRRRLAAHATVLRSAFPQDGRAIRGWLSRPRGQVAALSFLSNGRHATAIATSSGVQRVRVPRRSVPPSADRVRSAADDR
jgi:transcriptional regulator with XRE-family HTH domain